MAASHSVVAGDDRNYRARTDTAASDAEKNQDLNKDWKKNVPQDGSRTVSAVQVKEPKPVDAGGLTKKMTDSADQGLASCPSGNHLDELDGCQPMDICSSKYGDGMRLAAEAAQVSTSESSCKENESGQNKVKNGDKGQNGDVKVEELKSGNSLDQEMLKVQLQDLLHVLETSQDAEEKKAALQEISCLAESMKDVIRIELDDEDGDSSDGEESPATSSSEPVLNIPLPGQPILQSKLSFSDTHDDLTGIPLPDSHMDRPKYVPNTMFFDEDSSDIPLPPMPLDSIKSNDRSSRGKSNQDAEEGDKIKSVKTSNREKGRKDADSSNQEDEEDRALQTNTSLGPVTLHVNKKTVPRLSRASVFDLTDENAKEIGRKLLRLKRLKKLRKMEEVAEHKIEAKERISMWKEELLEDGCQLSLHGNNPVISVSGTLPHQEKTSEKPFSESIISAGISNSESTSALCSVKSENVSAEDVKQSTLNENVIKDREKLIPKQLSFVKVQSKDDRKELNWPAEMVQSTKLSPKLLYSCNPLEFDFGVTGIPKNAGEDAEADGKEKRRKKKKSHESSSRKKKNLNSSNSKELQGKNSAEGVATTGTGSSVQQGHGCKKQAADCSNPCPSSTATKGQDNSKDGLKKKSNRKKTPADGSSSKVAEKSKCPPNSNAKDDKKSLLEKGSNRKNSKKSDSKDKQMLNDRNASRPALEQSHMKDGGRKRRLSVGDIKPPAKKANVPAINNSAEAYLREGDGRVSDFEDVVDFGGGPGRWDTSSESEMDVPQVSNVPDRKSTHKIESKAREQRSRRSRTSSERDSSSSQDYSGSDNKSRKSHSRSRSYSSYSYYSSQRTRSYSSNSDYRWRHSRSSSTRSHSRRRRSYSYSDDSYRSNSGSYSRSRRSRSHSGSRDRYRSYSSYSHSSRSYSRSRSRSKSRSYRRYSRSYYKDRYHSKSRKSQNNQKHSKIASHDSKTESKSRLDANKINKKTDDLLSVNTKPSVSKSGQNKQAANVGASAKSAETQNFASKKAAVTKTEEKIVDANGEPSDKDLKLSEIPRPEDKSTLSIPLPSVKSQKEESGIQFSNSCATTVSTLTTITLPSIALSFIGPTLPCNHPLAHIQDIPIPKNEQFQPIGPNDPLVFKTPLLPPPPPPPFLTESGSKLLNREPPLPPKPRSPPPLPNDWTAMEDIAGDEEPIPHMLDLGAIKPAMIIPPEQAEQYRALQHQAQLHARQMMRQEAGITDEEEEEEPVEDDAQQQQLIEEMFLEQAQNAAFLTAPQVIHIPQQQLIAPTIGSSAAPQVIVGSAGFFQVPMSMQMVSTGHPQSTGRYSLVTLAPSMVPVLPQAGAPVVITAQSSGAMSALIRAHEAQAQAQAEAAEEAEAQAKAQVQASILQSQPHEWLQIVQVPGSGRALAVPAQAMASSMPHAITVSGLRSAGIPMHHGVIPVHAVNHPALHQPGLVQPIPLGLSMRVGLPSRFVGAPQVLASSAQPQGMPLLIDQTGNILVPRLMRPGHL